MARTSSLVADEQTDAVARLRKLGASWTQIATEVGLTPWICRYRWRKLHGTEPSRSEARHDGPRRVSDQLTVPVAMLADKDRKRLHPCLMCHQTMMIGWHFCDKCRDHRDARDGGRQMEV